MANPAKKIHAIGSGTGLLNTTRIAMTIPAIIMMIIPVFVALLKSFISYTHTNRDLSISLLSMSRTRNVW